MAGCSTTDGPKVITVQAQDYHAAFDAATQVASSHGLRPVVMDRGTGIIETAPRAAGSLLEPWRTDNAGLSDTLAHTVNFERRRMRVEFVPAGTNLPEPDPSKPVQAAALPGTDRANARYDLLTYTGTLEMRAWVYVERQFRPNQRIGSWTRGQTKYATDPLEKGDPEDTTTTAPGEWTPVGRDDAYERTVMAQIQRSLAAAPASSSPASAAGK